jgi:hypothetical protein
MRSKKTFKMQHTLYMVPNYISLPRAQNATEAARNKIENLGFSSSNVDFLRD